MFVDLVDDVEKPRPRGQPLGWVVGLSEALPEYWSDKGGSVSVRVPVR